MSSRTRCKTGGKIPRFKLGHPVFDTGIRSCMFPEFFFQNGVNFPRRLAMQKKKIISAHISKYLKSPAMPDMLPFSLCKKKRLAFRHKKRRLISNETIDSVLRNRKVGWTKELPATHLTTYSYYCEISYIYIYIYIYIQGVTGGTDQTSGECSLGQTIPI